MKQYDPYAGIHAERLEAIKTLDGNRADEPEHEGRGFSSLDLEHFGSTAVDQLPGTEKPTGRAQHHPSFEPQAFSRSAANAFAAVDQNAHRREVWRGEVHAAF